MGPYTTCYAIYSKEDAGYLDGKRADGALMFAKAPYNGITFDSVEKVVEGLSNLLLICPGLKSEDFEIHQCYIYCETRNITSSLVDARLAPSDLSAFVAKLG